MQLWHSNLYIAIIIFMKPSLVIWDWLGTIEKTENARFFITNKLLKQCNAKTFEANELKKMENYWQEISLSARNTVRSKIPIETERSSPWIAAYAIGLMKYFDKNNIIQCIISNGPSRDIKSKLSDMKLDYFDTIIGSEDGFTLKPNPSSVLHICKKYKIKNDDNVWFIGDSNQDMECAMHARIKGIQIKTDLSIVWDLINKES